ncbi:hypothetical protein TOK_3721 [Pseudonocardia sp. N23]|nr:hypothetical protein TOK_3721 [Pseudonocardia sp. N23]
MAQPAAIRSLRELEDILGVELYTRGLAGSPPPCSARPSPPTPGR